MKNVVTFGASGYVGTHFYEKYQGTYNVVGINRSTFDFLNPDFVSLHQKISLDLSLEKGIDALVFLQGINPSMGVHDINASHFRDMLSVNLIMPMEVINNLLPLLNKDASIIFISSVAEKKGSYDPSYASAKSGMRGLQQTLSNQLPNLRFNIISLGLVKGSPVETGMTDDFRQRHLDAMGNQLVDTNDVCKTIEFLIECNSVARSTISVDRGYRI